MRGSCGNRPTELVASLAQLSTKAEIIVRAVLEDVRGASGTFFVFVDLVHLYEGASIDDVIRDVRAATR
jgi:hypothetical protein